MYSTASSIDSLYLTYPAKYGILRYMTKIIIEINKQTGKWRFLDLELGVYSSDEWDTRNEAFKMSDKYRKKHDLKKYERM